MTGKRTRFPIIAIPDIVYGGEIWEWIVPKFPQMIVADAPDPKKNESLNDLAERMSERWLGMRLFREFPSMILVSFGATSALTLEALPHLLHRGIQVVAVLIVSGGRNELAWSYRQRARFACLRLLPFAAVSKLLQQDAHRELLSTEAEYKDRLFRHLQCLDDESVDRYRWVAKNLRRWRRSKDSQNCNKPVFQLHGRRNPILKGPSIHDATLLLTGEHFIPWTHPEQVERWMAAVVDDLVLKAQSDSPTK